ncbi:THUMP domain-containing class I SAM-dependent RNA methyltransferase [Ichthyobacterium seriolicida]|uniref:THUMP domain-containing class I SAM-dependent RNA methyltransferase n=1 Tax=Ichthyobacterium seriolicida TaxID=242600 RepID=UPI000BBC876F|nr:class I SAM-dependent RNA methyltransferase [Ichthyobacterium seriolicida]
MMKNYKMIAKTLYGLEDVLADELSNLGAFNIEVGIRNVSFYGDIGFMYKANLCLRTALKILKPICVFKIRSEGDFYKKVKAIVWEDYINEDNTILVDSVLSEAFSFSHTQYLSQRTKDAIVDRFLENTGRRPSVDKDSPDLRIHIHLHKETCTISLDSSGESLHKRGYKTESTTAPINEVLAAGIILLTRWKGDTPLLDPMCGSGTFLIEAAMIAMNIPANIHRKEFSFERWNDFDLDLFDKIKDHALNKEVELKHKIIGYDKSKYVVEKANSNIRNALLDGYIEVYKKDFFMSEKKDDSFYTLIFNPPYGERLSVEVESFYKMIGDTLKKGYENVHAWLIMLELKGLKHLGLRTSKRIKLFNGKLECRLAKYEIYKGSKKMHKA